MSKAKEYYESLYPKTNPSITDRDWINRISPISLAMNHKTLEDVEELIISEKKLMTKDLDENDKIFIGRIFTIILQKTKFLKL